MDNTTPNEPTLPARDATLRKGDAFAYHKVTSECQKELAWLRTCYREMRDLVEQRIPNTRERAIAITHLQTSLMFAIQAKVLADPDSEPQL